MKPLSNRHQSMISDVINSFNFQAVHIAMKALDWQWQTTDGDGHAVPSIKKLKGMARHLLTEAINYHSVGSGGLSAVYSPPKEDETEYFELKFVLATACSDDPFL